MPDSFLIALIIVAVLGFSLFLGYVIGKTSRRAGIAFTVAGIFLGLVLIVNYFEEVPVVVVAGGLVAFAGSMILGLFDVVRKDAVPPPA